MDKPRQPLDTTQFRRPLDAGGQPDLFYDFSDQHAAAGNRAVACEGADYVHDESKEEKGPEK
jgi:hypothetical protein